MGPDDIDICKSKLYVEGVNLDPDFVTELLQAAPDDKGKKGERSLRLGDRRSTSNVLKIGFWQKTIDSELGEELDVPDQLEHWCNELESRGEGVAILRSAGNELTIDFYISTGPVFLMRLPTELLKRLGDLGVNLKFGVYDASGKK